MKRYSVKELLQPIRLQQFIFKVSLFFCIIGFFTACRHESGRRRVPSEIEKGSLTINSRRSSHPRTNHTPKLNNKERDVSKISENKVSTLIPQKVLESSEIYESCSPAVFIIHTSDGKSDYQGSGFFVSKNGLAVSNYHVFKGTKKGFEEIRLSDNRIFKIDKVIESNEELDYIIFQVESKDVLFNYIPITRRIPKVGEKVYAIGSPYGLENTFSSGEISQLRENWHLQINVPIDHGSSGGALINKFGEVIGITSGGIEKSGANLNYAIDIRALNIGDYHINCVREGKTNCVK